MSGVGRSESDASEFRDLKEKTVLESFQQLLKTIRHNL